jgi:hypothetical protein
MQNSKRQIALSSFLVMLLYLVPNMVQDIHRIGGHQIHFGESHQQPGIQLYSQQEECPVCVFEFNVVDQLKNTVYIPYLRTESFVFTSNREDQFQKITFQYHNLRGPPKV